MLCRVFTPRVFATSLLLAMLAVLAVAGPARAADSALEAAMAESQESGMPLLVLGTATWCGPCQRLKQQLAHDEDLEPLLRQYVSVALDIESPEFARWKALHQPQSNTIPMLFIVTPEGNELYNASGVPRVAELARILNLGVAYREEAQRVAQLPAETAQLSAETEVPATEAAPSEPAEETASREGDGIEALPMNVREARAESYLRMAQVMATGRPERSRQYAEQAVEMAPDSREAALARKLLSTLPEYR